MKNYLNFEKDIKSLENEIEKLQDPFAKDGITQVETRKLAKLQNDLSSKLNEIYSGYLNQGKYKFVWNADTYVSGIYIIRAETKNIIETKKISLIK